MASAATIPFVRPYSRVLIASADSHFRRQLMDSPSCVQALREEAGGGAQALAKLATFSCESVLLDRNLPDLDSQEVAELIRRRYPEIAVEIVDARNQVGATDRPSTPDRPALEVVEIEELDLEPLVSQSPKAEPIEINTEVLPRMFGGSHAMREVYRLARMVAPRDTTVLVVGETGTGKELVAQAIHELSPRARQPFVVVNCAAIPEALFEAELFGYSRGAFTGAVQSRLGRIHMAQGGTLFLDEIGELPLSLQAKLLRFLQNGEVQRLGSSDIHKVDVRVVCATNVKLLDVVRNKQFRQDLYYRLAVFPIVVPPLRERTEDIADLSRHLLEKLCAENKIPGKRIPQSVLAVLEKSQWDGNVRELEHAIERAFILSGNDRELKTDHFRRYGESRQLKEI